MRRRINSPGALLLSICSMTVLYGLLQHHQTIDGRDGDETEKPVRGRPPPPPPPLPDRPKDEQCGCRDVDLEDPEEAQNQSMCSDAATVRGKGQRVLSFSVYGPVSYAN